MRAERRSGDQRGCCGKQTGVGSQVLRSNVCYWLKGVMPCWKEMKLETVANVECKNTNNAWWDLLMLAEVGR